MTKEPASPMRERARRALERSLCPVLPPHELDDSAFLARLEAALRSLPRSRREIFLAVRLDGASYAELAEQTGFTTRQVEREVARALAQIDRALDGGRAARAQRRLWRLLPHR